jgi:hypothetical protein
MVVKDMSVCGYKFYLESYIHDVQGFGLVVSVLDSESGEPGSSLGACTG